MSGFCKALGLTVVLAALLTARAEAEPKPQEVSAQAHLERGRRLYLEGRFEESILEFQTGYGLDPQPAFLYALGQAERRKGDCPKAIEYYRAFLKTHPPTAQDQAARFQLGRCEQEMAAKSPTTAPASPVVAAAAPVAPTDPAGQQPADLARDRLSRPPWYKDVLGDVLVGAGIVTVGIGAWLFFSASSDEESAAMHAPNYNTYGSELESAQTKRNIAVVSLAAGSALVVGGIIRYWLRPSPPAETQKVGLWFAPTAEGVKMGGHF